MLLYIDNIIYHYRDVVGLRVTIGIMSLIKNFPSMDIAIFQDIIQLSSTILHLTVCKVLNTTTNVHEIIENLSLSCKIAVNEIVSYLLYI